MKERAKIINIKMTKDQVEGDRKLLYEASQYDSTEKTQINAVFNICSLA